MGVGGGGGGAFLGLDGGGGDKGGGGIAPEKDDDDNNDVVSHCVVVVVVIPKGAPRAAPQLFLSDIKAHFPLEGKENSFSCFFSIFLISYAWNLKNIGELCLFQWCYFDEIRYIFYDI